MKIAARFSTPEMESSDFDEIMSAIKSGIQRPIVNAEDEEDGERVEVYIQW